MSSPKESNKFYEAERQSQVLSHSDFAREEDFDYLEETDELNDFLLGKNWDKYFTKQKSGITTCDVTIVNKVFESCMKHFGKKMDSVQIFSIITSFYDIDSKYYFDKLVAKHRALLVVDLEERIGKMKTVQKTNMNNRVQLAFNLIFKK